MMNNDFRLERLSNLLSTLLVSKKSLLRVSEIFDLSDSHREKRKL